MWLGHEGHRPLLAPSISTSGCYSVKIGGPTSISQHNTQQSHDWKVNGMIGARRAYHTGHLRHHPSAPPTVIMWKVVGQHLFLNIIPNNFTAGSERCDQGMKGLSHRPPLAPSVSISICNSVKIGGMMTISQHNLQHELDIKFGVIGAWTTILPLPSH